MKVDCIFITNEQGVICSNIRKLCFRRVCITIELEPFGLNLNPLCLVLLTYQK